MGRAIPWIKGSYSFLWTLVLLLGLREVTPHTRRGSLRDFRLLDAPPLTLLDTRLINLVTLGHRGLYDDFVSIWILQILADPQIDGVPGESLQRTLLNVTRHRPQIESLYLLSCYVLAFGKKEPQLCEPITQDGMAALPESWRIPMTQGFLEWNQLGRKDRGLVYYGLAAARRDAPLFLKDIPSGLLEKESLDPELLERSFDEILPPSAKQGRFRDLLRQRPSSAP